MVGFQAGYYPHGNHNTFIGYKAGKGDNSGIHTAHNNVAVGREALTAATSAEKNTVLGTRAAASITTQNASVIVGFEAGLNQQSGSGGNVVLGHQALYSGTQNYQNTAIGINAGKKATGASSNNVYIGSHAGPSSTGAESNKLYIHNAESDSPLIYGEFDNQLLKVNGGIIQNQTEALYLYDAAGGVYANPAIVTPLGNFALIKPEVGPGVGAIPVQLPEGTAARVGFETTIVNNVAADPASTLSVTVAQGTSDVIYEGSSNSASSTVSIGTHRGANKTFLLVDTGVWIVKA
tara:strand:- start:172 stop:1047 length:876 start_codon:yes stop_codon:yes gene_type:complete